jgi:hypothetical protein
MAAACITTASRLRGRVYFAIERLLERWTDRLVFVSDYERRAYEKQDR